MMVVGEGKMMMMMMFTYINYNERVSQNLYSIRFYIDQPKRHKYNKLSMIIRNKGSINDNESLLMALLLFTVKQFCHYDYYIMY
jgi:hypothetical protein